MNKITDRGEMTRRLLSDHCRAYPDLRAEDIFKYIYQSSFGCEHLVTSRAAALDYIRREYEQMPKNDSPMTEKLDGAYSRVSLSAIDGGLTPETLAALFCLSAKKELDGEAALKEKLDAAKEMVESGALPLDREEFEAKLGEWKESGFPPLHHSTAFREKYRPAYRVIADRYAGLLEVFSQIDKLLTKGSAIVAIEGGSASGKTTLSGILEEVYGCNVFHMDDFFLRPEQRTFERFKEIGGNVDRERFLAEVLVPTKEGKQVIYRPFDCSTQTLGEAVHVAPNKLTVVEGVYSMHPDLAGYYDHSIYLDISPDSQRGRILKRNSPLFAKRFFDEWIPLENLYFEHTQIKKRCTQILKSE